MSSQPICDGMHFDHLEVVAGPRYCPRCGRDPSDPGTLCRYCGERLRVQGYCPVCERHWPQDVGSDCPKHEVPLEPVGIASVAVDPDLVGARWVLAGTYTDDLAAEGARQRLEAEGIPTFVDGTRMGSRSMYNVATGGVRLLVPEPLADDARILLSQSWAPLPEIDGCDDDWDEPPTTTELRRHPIVSALIFFWVLAPVVFLVFGALFLGTMKLIAALRQLPFFGG